jgi:site-specific DNA-adenine methylase
VSKEAYGKHEMTEQDHIQLADVLTGFQGQVMLSG